MNKQRTTLRQPSRRRAPLHARGFTLIELMIAMVLGLIVISGVTSIFLANQRAYRTNAALSDVQEGSRIGFEMLARDVRGAGLTGCDSTSGRVTNVLNGGSTNWYADWANALHGYDGSDADSAVGFGTAEKQRVSGTDSLHVISAGAIAATVSGAPSGNAANLKINETSTDLAAGDIIVVCDYDHTAIAQITNYNSSNVTVVHNTGSSSPGNCTKDLSYPTKSPCNNSGSGGYVFPPNSQIAKLSAADWYIGNNPEKGKSLYRVTVQNSGGNVTPQSDEMVRNVTDMQIKYVQPSKTYPVSAASVTDWSEVDSAQITLTVQSTDQRAGTDAKSISRPFTFVATVRNRVQ